LGKAIKFSMTSMLFAAIYVILIGSNKKIN